MLKSLYIDNYALIEKLEISFRQGFNVITGETGAGKSIILGALALLLGKRADVGVLSNTDKKCVIEGVFDIEKLGMVSYFSDNDIDYDNVTLVRREILPSGRSRAFINDTPVKLLHLKYLGHAMVDIHSQHETLMLGQSGFQLQTLDSFIAKPNILNSYQKIYKEYIFLQKKHKELVTNNLEAKREEDYNRFLFEELTTAKLDVSEFENLIEREKFLIHAEDVIQAISTAKQDLSAGDEPLTDRIDQVGSVLSKIAPFLDGVQGLVERLHSLGIELKDIAAEIDKLNQLSDFDPNELSKINERLDLIYRLQQKHKVQSVEYLIKIKDDLAKKLQSIDSKDQEIETLEKDVAKLHKRLAKEAIVLSELRKSQSVQFSKAVKNILSQMAMGDAGFEVKIDKLEDFSSTGRDDVRFNFNANKGGSLKEVSQVASGGELSRLMLSVKSLITKEQLLPTVVFDEIDTGVSGDIAGKVGNILKDMAKHHQLIVITHLPQIAAKADHHYKVYKEIVDDSTYSQIRHLDNQERVNEIAKILSDEQVTEAAKNTAKELLRFSR